MMTNSVIEKSCHRVMMGKTYWKGVVLPSALYGAEVIDMKAEEIDKLQKAENTAMRRILKAPKWTAQAAIRGPKKRRDRNKQHEGENSKEQASLLKKDRNWK